MLMIRTNRGFRYYGSSGHVLEPVEREKEVAGFRAVVWIGVNTKKASQELSWPTSERT